MLAIQVALHAVLVAAVGNSDEAPQTPWPYASYPAALPHVLGVSALTPSGNVPSFSDRDRIFNDISAPGQEIYSTLPRALTSFRPLCQNQGYSDCGPDDFRHAAGTSFAAPQVTAAAAILFALLVPRGALLTASGEKDAAVTIAHVRVPWSWVRTFGSAASRSRSDASRNSARTSPTVAVSRIAVMSVSTLSFTRAAIRSTNVARFTL